MRLLSELYDDIRSAARLRLALFAALFLGGLALIGSLALSSVIFAGPLSPFVLNGTSMLLLGHIACFLVVALMSSHRGMVAIPQEAPAAVLATVGVTLTEVMDGAGNTSRFMTMVVLLILANVTTGTCLLLLGRYRIVRLLRLIPYPVTAGFLAGTGCILCVLALSVMSGLPAEVRALPQFFEPGMLWRSGPGVVFGVGLWLLMKSRWGGPHVLATSFALAVAIYHAGLAAGGISAEEARQAGLLLSGVPDHGLWSPFAVGDLALADWRTVAALAPSVLPAILATILCLSIYVSGIELDAGVELDTDREFRVAGVAGLVAAASGSVPGFQSLGYTSICHRLGADARLTGVLAAAVVILGASFGFGLLGAIPVPLAAAVLLFVGIDLLETWLIGVRKRVDRTEYGIVLLTCVTAASVGCNAGVGVGLLATAALVVVRLCGREVVEAEFTGRDLHSRKNRSIPDRALLLERGERIRAYRLSGYFFFGNAHRLTSRIRQKLIDVPSTTCILLDFSGISSVDVSAVHAIAGIARSAHARGGRLVLTATTRRFANHLRRSLQVAVRDAVVFEVDLDRGLERCENALLAAVELEHDRDGTARARLLDRVADDLLRHLDSQVAFEQMVSQLEPWVEPRDYQAGDRLTVQGELQAGAQLIVAGHASVYCGGLRLSQCAAGDAVEPLAAFGAYSASASTIADGPCRTMLFTANSRLLLEEFHPKLGLEFYRFLMTCEHARQHRSTAEHDRNENTENARLASDSRKLRIAVDTAETSPAPVAVNVPARDGGASRGSLRTEERITGAAPILDSPEHR